MRRPVRAGCILLGGLAGCSALPPVENPALVRPAPAAQPVENPVLVSPGLPTPEGYADTVERVLDALDDYFEVVPGSRYPGQYLTKPRPAAGVEQPWKAGSPDTRERVLATLQSIRHYAIVNIWAGERGGYRVSVEVYKELEEVPTPTGATRGAATFQETPTVDRRVEAATAVATTSWGWIPAGRDPAFEQVILQKIQHNCR